MSTVGLTIYMYTVVSKVHFDLDCPLLKIHTTSVKRNNSPLVPVITISAEFIAHVICIVTEHVTALT